MSGRAGIAGAEAPRRLGWGTLAACVGAFLVARALLVLSLADVSGYGEEFAKGSVAKAILDGLGVEHHRLAYAYHEGGGFAVAHAKALAFLAVGPSVLAHKLVALATSALVLAAALRLAGELFGRGAAVAFTAAFTLAPSTMQRASLFSLGTHFEAMLFVLLALHATARLVSRPSGAPARRGDAWALGLASGFGVYFSLVLVPALAAVAAALAVRGRGRLGRGELARVAAGFALGALPLWWMLARVGLDVWSVRGESPVDRPRLGVAEGALALVGPVVLSRDPWAWLAALATVGLAALGLARAGRVARGLVLGYLGLYALAFVASGLGMRYDPAERGAWFRELRLVPLWLFGTLFAAGGLAALWSRGGRERVLANAALGALLAVGARDAAALVRDGRPARPIENLRVLASTRGYLHREYFPSLREHLEGDRRARAEVLLRLDEEPELLLPAVADALFGDAESGSTAELVRALGATFGDRAPLALLGLGQRFHRGGANDVEGAFARLEELPPHLRAPLAEGLGRAGLGPRFRELELDHAIRSRVPERWRSEFLRGIGWRVQQTFRLRPDRALAWIAAQEEASRTALLEGYEEARRLDSVGDAPPAARPRPSVLQNAIQSPVR